MLQLEQQGRLSLDEPMSRFVPEYPAFIAEQVTIRHLLTHTSGIELDDDPEFNRLVAEARSLSEILAAHVERIEHLNEGRYADFRPLESHDYSNENYDLLGVIIERASGQPWQEYVHEHVLPPAGMTHTGMVDGLHEADIRPLIAPVRRAGDALRPPYVGIAVTPGTDGTHSLMSSTRSR